ncbi:molybdopterin-dependent oxidoreductase [Martelella mangrovi]|uniref:Oxidoreductase molybdopterin-binding domain-containing protein n=1 Tax=Martelella mangrovi TaxID=1397477 RepID=A0ABV2IFE4_9HYPH
MFQRLFLTAVLTPFLLIATASAEDLPAPMGRVILTVSGNIGVTNADGAAEFDLAMLDALPQTRFTTETIWTDKAAEYSGVELSALLEAVDADGSQLLMTALNDYAIDVPASEAVSGGPILATRVDGHPLSVRDKGPVWVIYPFDDKPAYKTEITYSRSIWQLKSIEVED